MLGILPGLLHAQVGVKSGGGSSLFSCAAQAAATPELRPEGYTELLGDIVISCTGGPTLTVGAAIPTTNVIVYISPAVPITSRILSSTDKSSEAMLIIDEPGASISTGATGGYGPQAPQSLCTTAQQTNASFPCQANVGLDNSGQYQVAVAPNTTTPAQNVYQGRVGDYGVNSVAFYNVPVLPPALQGVSRIIRITNIRIPVPGGAVNGTVQAIISTNPNQTLPVAATALNVGFVGPSMNASVNSSPAGGGSPFYNCAPLATPTLSARLTYTEAFATGFKTRVIPGGAANNIPGNGAGNTTFAAQAQNLASPSNQNIPGGLYGSFAGNDESGFILPAATYKDPTSNITYTAGLADYGTRLKAVFSNIPAGVTIYVSTTSTGASPLVPGGTSLSPYAVLVAASQSGEAIVDGSNFAPLTSTAVGSDGLDMYQLTPDSSGITAAAVWEVVNSNPFAFDNLTFSVYIAYSGQLTASPNPMTATLSYSPEPGGGTFPTVNGTAGLDGPSPRYGVIKIQNGPYAAINLCPLFVSGALPIQFNYAIGGALPPGAGLKIYATPSNLAVSVNYSVTTPAGGTWLSAAINSGFLDIAVNPSGLAASGTAYTGTVQLSATGVPSFNVPVTLTVYPASQFLIAASHIGNFGDGQTVTATIVVSNASATAPATGTVTVTSSPSSGLALVSMMGTGWNCSAPTCTQTGTLAAAGNFQPITVTMNVSSEATSPQIDAALLSIPGFLTLTAYDTAIVTSGSCDINSNGSVTVSDVQYLIGEVLGGSSPTGDLNFDGVVNIADVQIVVNAILNSICIV